MFGSDRELLRTEDVILSPGDHGMSAAGQCRGNMERRYKGG
jgi:hypothetical protein